MQNELRNQVRTLKRVGCLICCLFAVPFSTGCSSTPLIVAREFAPSAFSAVAIKNLDVQDAKTPVMWGEIEIAQFFEDLGYEVIGEDKISDYPENKVLVVRYNAREWGLYRCRIWVVIESASTGRAMCTVDAQSGAFTRSGARRGAQQKLFSKLRRAFSPN